MGQGMGSAVGHGRDGSGRANWGQLTKGFGCRTKEGQLRFLTGSGVICIGFDKDYSGKTWKMMNGMVGRLETEKSGIC